MFLGQFEAREPKSRPFRWRGPCLCARTKTAAMGCRFGAPASTTERDSGTQTQPTATRGAYPTRHHRGGWFGSNAPPLLRFGGPPGGPVQAAPPSQPTPLTAPQAHRAWKGTMDVQAPITYPSDTLMKFNGLRLQDGGGMGLLVVPQTQLSHSGTPSPPRSARLFPISAVGLP